MRDVYTAATIFCGHVGEDTASFSTVTTPGSKGERLHGEDPLEGTCVHADDRNYGTRSSTLVSIPHDGAPTVHHADGPPCTVPYADLSALAKQL